MHYIITKYLTRPNESDNIIVALRKKLNKIKEKNKMGDPYSFIVKNKESKNIIKRKIIEREINKLPNYVK